MNTKIISTVVGGLLSLSVLAQQDAGFSQYFFNQMYINPAYAGSRKVLSGTLVHRSQWVNIDGAPTTQSLTIHSPIPNTRAGAGIQFYNDKSGPLSNTAMQGVYSYYIPVGTYRLAFGIAGSLHNMRIALHDINIDDKSDAAFTGGNTYSWVPDANAGVYLYKDRFYAGLSSTHLFQSKFNLAGGGDGANAAKFFRTYYLTSGVVVNLHEKVDFRPSILLKWVQAAPPTLDLNASFILYQSFFIGGGFRTSKRINIEGMDNQVVAIAEYHFKGFRLGYSYDWYLNRTGGYTSGTHEILVGFDINISKTKMSSPIFF